MLGQVAARASVCDYEFAVPRRNALFASQHLVVNRCDATEQEQAPEQSRNSANHLHGSDTQIPGDTLRGLAAFMHGCHDQVGAAHHVATGEDFRIARLVRARPK